MSTRVSLGAAMSAPTATAASGASRTPREPSPPPGHDLRRGGFYGLTSPRRPAAVGDSANLRPRVAALLNSGPSSAARSLPATVAFAEIAARKDGPAGHAPAAPRGAAVRVGTGLLGRLRSAGLVAFRRLASMAGTTPASSATTRATGLEPLDMSIAMGRASVLRLQPPSLAVLSDARGRLQESLDAVRVSQRRIEALRVPRNPLLAQKQTATRQHWKNELATRETHLSHLMDILDRTHELVASAQERMDPRSVQAAPRHRPHPAAPFGRTAGVQAPSLGVAARWSGRVKNDPVPSGARRDFFRG